MTAEAWLQAADDFETNVLPVLEKHGKAIGASALNGNAEAKAIVGYYDMLTRSFDPMTAVLLDSALKAWLGGKQ